MAAQLVKVRFDIDGDVQFSRAFEAYGNELRDMREPLNEIGDSLIEAVGLQFQTEGAYGLGTKWRPLSRTYTAWKAEHFPGRPLLVATGEMRREMLDRGESVRVTAQQLVYEPKGERVEQGIPVFHQKGKGHNPMRKMVELPSARRRQFERIFAEWLNRVRRGPIGAR